MEQYVIVGGGIAGLMAARSLKAAGIPFVGLEKSNSLGGRLEVGHHRLYELNSTRFISSFIDDLEWETVEDTPQERRKGSWVEAEADKGKETIAEELFYMRSPFFIPKINFADLVLRLGRNVKENFIFRKSVIGVDSENRKVICQDGTEFSYEKVVWCNSLESLNRVWKGDKAPLLKVRGKAEDLHGGLNLDIEVDGEFLPGKNTVVFPFRFKDHKLRALGTQTPSGDHRSLHWLLFLPEVIAENREEVAKCVRTLRRELEKEFPEMKAAIKSERIVYLPAISGEVPRRVKTLNLLPRVFYLGPEITIREEEGELRNIDVIVDNCKALQGILQA